MGNLQIAYCAGCNEGFEYSESMTVCPVCQRDLENIDATTGSMDELASTISLTDGRVRTGRLSPRLVGKSFGSNYRVDSFLGRGGMAWVFKAEHLALRRHCAIKILCPQVQGRSDRSLTAFIEEARTSASLSHPNIVEVHNIGEAMSYHYIELEFVPGRSLQEIILVRGNLSPIVAVKYAAQATAALGLAHDHELIHRDIKPSNMLVRPDGFLKLADFGLAKRISGEGSGPTTLSGTPNFMAPELFQGEAASFESDAYALGVSLFHMLTGAFPFTGDNLKEVRHSHLNDPVPDVRKWNAKVPEIVAEFIMRCIAKEPEARPSHGSELHCELQAIFLTLRDLPSLVDEAFKGSHDVDVDLKQTPIAVTVPLPQGRKQIVYIEENDLGISRSPLVRIFTICGEATEAIYERALLANNKLEFGSCGLDRIDGKMRLIMISTIPHAACEPDHIRETTIALAAQGDIFESLLSTEDNC